MPFRSILVACFTLGAASGYALDPLFADPHAGPLTVKLTGPISQITKKRREPETFDGKFEIEDSTFDVVVSQRGKSRLKECSFEATRSNRLGFLWKAESNRL